MKLYTTQKAPNPRRVMMFLAEKGLLDPATNTLSGPFAGTEIVEVSLIGQEHKTDAFKKISPLSQLPALQLGDGRTLTESRAICRYIEGLAPEPNLFGHSFEEEAFIEMWDRRTEWLLMLPGAMAVRHLHPLMGAIERQITEYGENTKQRFLETCAWLDGVLAAQPFVAGQRFTIADITTFVGLEFPRLIKLRADASTHPHLARWREMMAARPSASAGM